MTYFWYVEYALVIFCSLLLVGWLTWLARRSKEWSARLVLQLARIFGVMAVLGFSYNVLADSAVRRELLAGDFGNPHLLLFLLAWGWEAPAVLLLQSLALYRAARRAEASGNHPGLLRATLIIASAAWLGWIIAVPVFMYAGQWTWSQCLVLVAGGLIIVSTFSLSVYVRLEPVIAARFNCSALEVPLGQRLTRSLLVVFINIILVVMVVLIGNRGESRVNALYALAAVFVLFCVPYFHLVQATIRSIVSPLVEMAKQMGTADTPRFVGIVSRDEVSVVANSHNALTQRLYESYAALEDKVAARTAELAQTNEELEKEIEERARIEAQLRVAKEGAEAATLAKSEFLANVSHEIRTPMTAILGFSEDLLDPDLSASEGLNTVHTIRRNGEHLLQIINDVLDISKIEAGKLEIEGTQCSPVQVVADVRSLMQGRADAKGLAFGTEYVGPIPETIQSDPTRLKQILVNLVGNAIKFTETGGIRIAVRCVDPDSDRPMMQFDVIDSGIGLTPVQAAKLFQAFAQADTSTTRKFGGTGLGLTISKRLAEMLGGGITVDSRPGEGSTFRVTISTGPLDLVGMVDRPSEVLVDADRTMADSPSEPGKLDCHVLLAEDGPDNQRLITRVLEKAGAEVTVKENGKLAAEAALAEGSPFDVILMDMQMPVMDGYEATGLLRLRGYDRPIIALTAHAMASDREKCIAAGCDDYVAKPINRKMLIETIGRHLAKGH